MFDLWNEGVPHDHDSSGYCDVTKHVPESPSIEWLEAVTHNFRPQLIDSDAIVDILHDFSGLTLRPTTKISTYSWVRE